MKVKELIESLSLFPDDVDVMLQTDSEGNGYAKLIGVDVAIWKDDEMYSLDWTADDCCLEENVWKDMKDYAPRCAVLYP